MKRVEQQQLKLLIKHEKKDSWTVDFTDDLIRVVGAASPFYGCCYCKINTMLFPQW